VYGTLFERAGATLADGQWAVLTATFRDQPLRDRAAAVADDAGVSTTFVKVTCEESVAVERIRNRTRTRVTPRSRTTTTSVRYSTRWSASTSPSYNSGAREETRERVAELF
jgi:predicted kinase